MGKRDLDEEFSREELRDMESKRRAREKSDVLSLIERAALLLVSVVAMICAMIHSLG